MKKTFEQFIESRFKSFSHGHEWTHEEIDGLYYRKEDYELALEKYADYEWSQFSNKIFKGSKNEKGNELAWRK